MADREDDLGGSVAEWELIRRVVADVHDRVLAQINAAGPDGRSVSVLLALLHAPNQRLPMSVLARRASMTSGGFTRLADRLGRAGFIDRRDSDEDRRVVYASLTQAGLLAAGQAETQYQAALASTVLRVIAPARLGAVADALSALDAEPQLNSEPHLADAEVPHAADRRVVPERRRRSDRPQYGSGH